MMRNITIKPSWNDAIPWQDQMNHLMCNHSSHRRWRSEALEIA